jgi:hypothetical protein
VIETDLARRKNKGMLPRARRGNFYDLPGLLLITYRSLIKPVLKGTFSGEIGVFMIIAIINTH